MAVSYCVTMGFTIVFCGTVRAYVAQWLQFSFSSNSNLLTCK